MIWRSAEAKMSLVGASAGTLDAMGSTLGVVVRADPSQAARSLMYVTVLAEVHGWSSSGASVLDCLERLAGLAARCERLGRSRLRMGCKAEGDVLPRGGVAYAMAAQSLREKASSRGLPSSGRGAGALLVQGLALHACRGGLPAAPCGRGRVSAARLMARRLRCTCRVLLGSAAALLVGVAPATTTTSTRRGVRHLRCLRSAVLRI
ncbi:unnamed protein product [Prorocentrum cordatum]|uniref:Uncharacterized protein n=1 Tax=Prorocentrum cordatum TaxID=2364126 RepID=A0ABN9TMD6_9DINO|nr:unnamed protein product [Polarella glacialis]